MELIVTRTVGGEIREERVTLRRDGDRWRIAVGERRYTVDAQHLDAADGDPGPGGGGLWSLIVDGAQHEVAVATDGNDRYRVSAGGSLHAVGVTDPLTHLARQAHGAAAGGGETVTAYMPGRVAAVLVAEGDEVEAGQGVVVLEAMKMENEIAPEHGGKVAKLHVEEGQAVEGGDPLFDLEPLTG